MSINKEMAETILRQGELFLGSTLSVALSADQRAATLAAIFSGASVAVTGAMTQVNEDIALLSAGILLAALWFITSVLFIVALWPSKYHLPGNYPSMWLTEDVAEGDVTEAIVGECENYDERIRFNVARLRRASLIFKRGVTIAVAAPLIAVSLWAIITLSAAAGA